MKAEFQLPQKCFKFKTQKDVLFIFPTSNDYFCSDSLIIENLPKHKDTEKISEKLSTNVKSEQNHQECSML